ncbi:MAG: mannose-1-phosphate guanylyltransferase/mannose-6-phosphate isomerase [Brevinematia bacterium]
MKSVILAGGEGTRLWPLSRRDFPKQFLSIGNNKSFLQQTLDRILAISEMKDIYVVSGENYRFLIREQVENITKGEFDNLILEPAGRNTAPAIMLSIKYFLEKLKTKRSEVLFFTPADHIILPKEEFKNIILESEKPAKESIVVFGIVPHKPETGYGYIEIGENIEKTFYKVEKFVEKPSSAKAKEYLESKKFLWNSGMFMFSIEVMLENFKKHQPEMYKFFENNSYDGIIENYSKLEKISIDYAIIEKSTQIVCNKVNITWNDIGSWEAVYDILKKDEAGNVVMGEVFALESNGNLVISEKRLASLIGVKDLIIVDTPDALLICDRKSSQRVKDIVERMKNKNKVEALEHKTVYRPWGNYTVLEESERYKIKKIIVKEGASLSLQRHFHRSEHWVVVKGTAKVQVGEEEILLHENESTYIPKSIPHRLSNPGKIPLEIIEVQNGEYIGEDDIERLEDRYGR